MNTDVLGYTREELDARGALKTACEIWQQPDLWREVAATAAARRAETQAFLHPLLERPDLRIVLTGAGTSAFAGEVLAPALTRVLRRRVDAIPTTDIVSNARACFAENLPTLVVSFARSGDSPESVAATELAEQCLDEVRHLVITCNAEGELYRRHRAAEGSLALLMPERANDEGFAMTSSFTCMLLTAWLTLTPPGLDAGARVERLAGAGERILDTCAGAARALAEHGYERIIYLGSGPLTGLARESALKSLELTAGEVVSYFDSSLGFRHGPKSVVNDRTVVLGYLSNDAYTRQYDIDILDELRRSLGPDNVVAIGTDAPTRSPQGGLWVVEGLGDVDDAELALPAILCAQMVGLSFSLALGHTADNPSPSGEVNRVVKGVIIHSLPKPAE